MGDIRNFLWSSFITNLGNGLQILGAGFIAYETTESIYSLAFVFLAYSAPQLFASYFVSPVLERFGPRGVAAFSDFMRAILLGGLGLAVFLDHNVLFFTYLLTFCSSALDAFYQPASNSLFQQVMSKHHELRKQKSSQLELLTQVAMLLSVTGGAVLVDVIGIYFAFILNAVTFFVAGVLICFISVDQDSQPIPEKQNPIRHYLSTVAKYPGLVLNFSLGRMIPAVVNTLIIYLVIGPLDKSFSALGLVDAVAILGIGIGVWSVRFVRDSQNNRVMSICMYASAFFIGLAGQGEFNLLVGAFFVSTGLFGLSRVIARINILDAVHESVAPAIYATANVVSIVGAVILTIFVCVIADVFGIAFGFLALGVCFAASTFFISTRSKQQSIQRESHT